MRTKTFTLRELKLHTNGIPPEKVADFACVARAAIRSGCTLPQARCIAKLAYFAASGFHWNIEEQANGLRILSLPIKIAQDRGPR